ncbi:MAG TPA: hypothetical protein VH877_17665 [Polyangia bacterium]|jgi:hypothetical protein|nr:hypothetical protein [Polyangia bacterium]
MRLSELLLYYVCATAGFIMVAGGIFMLYKQKIYIDRESQQITEIETPLLGKFRTNVPALVLFVLGFVPLIYPLWVLRQIADQVEIVGTVKSTAYPVYVYAVTGVDTVRGERQFGLTVPLSAKEYRILYLAGNAVVEDRATLQDIKQGQLVLPAKEIQVTAPRFEPDLAPIPAQFGGGTPEPPAPQGPPDVPPRAPGGGRR